MRRARRRRRLSPLACDLVAALAPDRVRDDSASRTLHAHDSSVFGGGVSGPVCYPVSAAEVEAIMRISAAHGRAVVPRGAGSGLAGGAINSLSSDRLSTNRAFTNPGAVHHLGPVANVRYRAQRQCRYRALTDRAAL